MNKTKLDDKNVTLKTRSKNFTSEDIAGIISGVLSAYIDRKEHWGQQKLKEVVRNSFDTAVLYDDTKAIIAFLKFNPELKKFAQMQYLKYNKKDSEYAKQYLKYFPQFEEERITPEMKRAVATIKRF
ncbi:MAG: hypothetical protein KGH54_04590 [Candidatus Micrarchaeota archaeon]|nr:hypothetical protein [Candidatus Micrarchaeota archaeon]